MISKVKYLMFMINASFFKIVRARQLRNLSTGLDLVEECINWKVKLLCSSRAREPKAKTVLFEVKKVYLHLLSMLTQMECQPDLITTSLNRMGTLEKCSPYMEIQQIKIIVQQNI